jgi:hypothetical protein
VRRREQIAQQPALAGERRLRVFVDDRHRLTPDRRVGDARGLKRPARPAARVARLAVDPRPPARHRHGRIVLFRGCGNFRRNIIKLLIFSHFLCQFEVKNSAITAT